MKKLKITAKQIRALGYPSSPIIPIAMEVINKEFKFNTLEQVSDILSELLKNPAAFTTDIRLEKIVNYFINPIQQDTKAHTLNAIGIPIAMFGEAYIDATAIDQMHVASKLPISVGASLMPDAHSGYGLPIGGVLATANEIIPYAVGVDIGCRMSLSVYNIPGSDLRVRDKTYTKVLDEHTLFGAGKQFETSFNHEVLDNALFNEIKILKNLHGKAFKQLGSSGSGNHFAEFGIVKITTANNKLQLPIGEYVGLLTHSGSRALGASIADNYTNIAKQNCKLASNASNLAWLDLNSEAGQEYWLCMNLAGQYAKACHDVMHQRISKALHAQVICTVENHHNFAWKEKWKNQDVIVHRKGATPAKLGELGIIPGNMVDAGYIISGKGNEASINSASHGAGRLMSRSRAKSSISHNTMKEILKKNNVTLIGAGIDEAPQAYKNIEQVIKAQSDLLNIEGTFTPKIVKMDKA